MNAPYQTIRGRIGELTEELVRELVDQGVPEEGMSLLRRMLEAQLGHERLRPLIEASLQESAEDALDRFVVSMDPEAQWVTLACKN